MPPIRFFALWFALSANAGMAWGEELHTGRDADGTLIFASQSFEGSERLPAIAYPVLFSGTRTPHRPRAHEQTLRPLIERIALAEGMDPALVSAIAAVESRFNPLARSPKGAQGLMQLMPATAAQHGVRDAYNAEENLRGGARYLKTLLAAYGNNVPLALAAYNAGQGNIQRHRNRVPPFKETMLYVPQVLAQMEIYRQQTMEQPAP